MITIDNKILEDLFDALRHIRCGILSAERNYRHREVLKRNSIFHNIHKGERCFIIANGPSIKSQNLHLLMDETCFAVNYFYLHKDYGIINPQYYCMTHNHGMNESHYDTIMESLEKYTSQDTTFFFPLADMQRCLRGSRFEDRNIYFINYCNMSFKYLKDREIDLTRTVPSFQSVSIMALEIAIYMGFSEIFLIGHDHDWILNDMRGDYHGYDDEKQHILHMDNLYVVDEGSHGNEQYFEEGLKSYLILWGQYRALKDIAYLKGIKIYNATKGGLLNVFPRVEYEKLFDE